MENATLPVSAPDATSPAVQESGWLVENEFMRIQFQHGLAPVVGVNGVRVDDVIEAAIARLDRYQQGSLACRENVEALDALHRAKDAMARRRSRRVSQGVYNTYEPHKGERTEDRVEDFSATGA